MNLVTHKDDSEEIARGKIDKAVVIQNLFRRLSKSGRAPNFFFNYSLDTRLSPMRRSSLEELVDNHPQTFENKREFLHKAGAS